MKIKVQCPCQTRFEFEVEPVQGRMPVIINCPTCGADATDLANALIQQQSAAAPASGLRISHSTHAATAPTATVDDAEPVGQLCAKHKTEPAAEVCCVCGKPICLKCMEQFGYVCSVYCRQQATQKRIYVPVYAHQKSVVADKSYVLAKRITYAVTAVAVLLLGFWFWYAWFARNYKIVYSLPIPKRDVDLGKSFKPDEFYQLIGPGQLLSVKNKQVSLFDLAQQKLLWSVPLQTEAEAAAIKAARAKNEEIQKRTPKVQDENGFDTTRYAGLDPLGYLNDYYFANPHVIATTNDVWVTLPDRLARFDRQTGARKEIGIMDKILSISETDNAILVISGTPGVHETLTEIMLPEGTLQTEDITTQAEIINPSAPKIKGLKPTAATNKLPIGQLKIAALQAAAASDSDLDATSALWDEDSHPFIPAGPNVVQFKTKLLERKTIAHDAMKPKGKSVLDNNNLTASQGLDVAQEMMNDSRRELNGGMETEDVSRYQVSIHRRFAQDIPDWTGEVIGPPRFYALKTVDIVTAGQSLYVFDKRNKKLWEAKLTFSAPPRYSEDATPVLETEDALYFADLGMLTRYDLATGNVRWRYNSVGISRVKSDERGALYLSSTTAGPESIQYSQQINIKDKIHPLLLKLAPETGKVLWRLESIGDRCLLSGKFLYATRISTAYAALRLEDGPDTHYNLNLLAPANGNVIWNFHRGNQRLIKTEVQKNWILVHFQDEVLVLKFFSL